MTKVIDLESKRKGNKNRALPSSDAVKLWNLSLLVDKLIQDAVVKQGLPPEEIAALLAHRLGSLLACCEDSAKLTEFCQHVMLRQCAANVKDEGA